MAFLDDRDWLISHIRHCFVTSDETGLCERIIAQDEEWERLVDGDRGRDVFMSFGSWTRNDEASSDSDGFSQESSFSSSPLASPVAASMPHSFEIRFGLNYSSKFKKDRQPVGIKVKKDKTPAPKQRNFDWRREDVEYDPESMGHLFERKEIPARSADSDGDAKPLSSLSKLLTTVADLPEDPFFSFAQFDAASHPGVAAKRIDIFLMMCSGEDRWQPMPVVVQCTARVSDLIGLICHHYSRKRRVPPLKNLTVDGYSLYIADDDGEVDDDIPPLDSREPITKFDFTSLALVEKDSPPSAEDSATIITVNIPQRGWHKVQIENPDVPMKVILKIVLQRRRKKEGRGIEYVLEKQSEPGIPVDLEKPLKEMETLEFCLIRLNSVRGDERPDDEVPAEEDQRDSIPEILGILPSLPEANRRYKVSVVKKFKANAEVHLDIDGERLEVTPISGSGSSVKPLNLEMQTLIHAEIVEEKAKGKATFRVRYQSGGNSDAKHIDFKCLSMVAREIVDRVNAVLDFRTGLSGIVVRREKTERRSIKRHSLLP